MLAIELLSLLASACAFGAGFLLGARWQSGRGLRIVTRPALPLPASPPMRPPTPQVDSGARSPYAPRPKPKPTAKPPGLDERIVRWRTDADNSPPKPTTKPADPSLPKVPTLAAAPPKPPAIEAAPAGLLPSISWGQSCASK